MPNVKKTYYDHMKADISFTTGYWKCNWANVKLIYAVMPQGKLYFDKKGTKMFLSLRAQRYSMKHISYFDNQHNHPMGYEIDSLME